MSPLFIDRASHGSKRPVNAVLEYLSEQSADQTDFGTVSESVYDVNGEV